MYGIKNNYGDTICCIVNGQILKRVLETIITIIDEKTLPLIEWVNAYIDDKDYVLETLSKYKMKFLMNINNYPCFKVSSKKDENFNLYYKTIEFLYDDRLLMPSTVDWANYNDAFTDEEIEKIEYIMALSLNDYIEEFNLLYTGSHYHPNNYSDLEKLISEFGINRKTAIKCVKEFKQNEKKYIEEINACIIEDEKEFEFEDYLNYCFSCLFNPDTILDESFYNCNLEIIKEQIEHQLKPLKISSIWS